MATSLQQEIDDTTECSICIECYTYPRMLPCIHTFCLVCLNQYTKGKSPGDKSTFPLCRLEFTIPERGIEQYPFNFVISRLVHARKLPLYVVDDVICDLCAETGETDPNKVETWQCLNCAENLCSQCCKSRDLVDLTRWLRLEANRRRIW